MKADIPALPSVMHHNTALLCMNNTLHAWGGQHNFAKNNKGVKHAVLRNVARWSFDKMYTFDGHHRGCKDIREKVKGICEFDGKLSAVLHKGALMIFARSNLNTRHGARHVQMISSTNRSSWTDFRQIEVDGIRTGAEENNIYYLNVQSFNREWLLGLFPGVITSGGQVQCGAFSIMSRDGLKWTSPVLIRKGTCMEKYRTDVHPGSLYEGRIYLLDKVLNAWNYKNAIGKPRVHLVTNASTITPDELVIS